MGEAAVRLHVPTAEAGQLSLLDHLDESTLLCSTAAVRAQSTYSPAERQAELPSAPPQTIGFRICLNPLYCKLEPLDSSCSRVLHHRTSISDPRRLVRAAAPRLSFVRFVLHFAAATGR
jgi:hypothetical protein